MKSTSTKAITNLLRGAGSKITGNRIAVLEALRQMRNPASVEDIQRALKNNTINQATIYRIVKAFLKAGILQEVELRHGHLHVELADRPHHHHFVCDRCGTITSLNVKKDQAVILSLEREHGFSVRDHSLELFGLCATCRRDLRSSRSTSRRR